MKNAPRKRTDTGPRSWTAWLRAIESATHLDSLDGDQKTDGYSLDYCFEMYEDGIDIKQAIGNVVRNIAAAKPLPGAVEMIDMTPTWSGAFEAYMAVLENGTETGKQIARKEIRRAGQLLDKFQKREKEEYARLGS